MTDLDPATRTELEAAVFRALMDHLLVKRPEVQNIDLMNLAGFCRNCLSRWYQEAAEARGLAMTKDEAREVVYGMPYGDWVAQHQTPADAAKQAEFAAAFAANVPKVGTTADLNEATSSPLGWARMLRATVTIPTDNGVYALFLRKGSVLPGISPKDDGLLYIGKAEGRQGLSGRCHFDARTRNHSPRKSLAVLLKDRLGLIPILVPKPNSSPTWGLDAESDGKLSAWMHSNLEIALEVCANPDGRERELVSRYAPPLNLDKCEQSEQHRRISALRGKIFSSLNR